LIKPEPIQTPRIACAQTALVKNIGIDRAFNENDMRYFYMICRGMDCKSAFFPIS
jgi:hypothetical protein